MKSKLVDRLGALARVHSDKLLHCLIECVLVTVCKLIFCWWFAILVGIAVGVYKEYKDDKFDKQDLVADGVGILLGVL